MEKKHNNITDESIRLENNLFNENFLNSFDLSGIETFGTYESNDTTLLNDRNRFQTVWFKNIDRLIKMIPDTININHYHLMDVGSGLGFSTIYFKEKYDLKSFSGFDYDLKLVQLSNEISKRIYSSDNIKFFQSDASKYILDGKKSFILFIFNSFGKKTLQKFISNNIDRLKKNNSIILYCNDHHYTEINGHTDFIRNDYFNLSVFIFN